ncbi:MAG TPA: hypothetical protein VKE93_08665 [Candidatus Angelobacter sp.]|nr:hypothetical protein [Candidatus Angelobacter sp.]
MGVPTVPGSGGAGLPGEHGWATVELMEARPFTVLAPLTLALVGGVPPAGVVPAAEDVPVVVLGEDSGGGGTVVLDPVDPVIPEVVVALHGPATVLTTGGVPVVPGMP